MGIDAIVALVSLFGPKLIDMTKGWIHRKDSPEATVAALAQANPDALAKYVEAQSKLIEAGVKVFNEDISGTISTWVSNLRASIRPIVTIVAMCHIVGAHFVNVPIPEGAMYLYEAAIGSWFGSRLK